MSSKKVKNNKKILAAHLNASHKGQVVAGNRVPPHKRNLPIEKINMDADRFGSIQHTESLGLTKPLFSNVNAVNAISLNSL